MDQQPWHDYNGESADALFALTATHRIDSLVVAFEMAIQRKAAAQGLSALSTVELDVLAVEALEREVNNGGYSQFFFNSSNEFASIIVDALERIGCPETAAITARAIAALPAGTGLTGAALDAEMAREDAARDTELSACNQAYFNMSEDIAGILMRYLQAHRSEIKLLA